MLCKKLKRRLDKFKYIYIHIYIYIYIFFFSEFKYIEFTTWMLRNGLISIYSHILPIWEAQPVALNNPINKDLKVEHQCLGVDNPILNIIDSAG